MTVAVVKLGVGNTASVLFALERLGVRAVLTDDVQEIEEADRIVLPGVGAAAYAMKLIEAKGLRDTLRKFERPLLGICLGQQLLFESSEEGDARGLGLLPGRVVKLSPPAQAPIPHMGWSRLAPMRKSPLLEGLKDDDYAYFVHSYICPADSDATIATAEYGTTFAAVVGRGSAFGCQFHPERSGAVGARVLANFLALPC